MRGWPRPVGNRPRHRSGRAERVASAAVRTRRSQNDRRGAHFRVSRPRSAHRPKCAPFSTDFEVHGALKPFASPPESFSPRPRDDPGRSAFHPQRQLFALRSDKPRENTRKAGRPEVREPEKLGISALRVFLSPVLSLSASAVADVDHEADSPACGAAHHVVTSVASSSLPPTYRPSTKICGVDAFPLTARRRRGDDGTSS